MDWLPCCTHVKSTLPHDVWVVLNVCTVKIIVINKIKRASIGANIKKKCYQSKTYRVIYICFTECILQCIFCAFFRFSSRSIQLLLCLSWEKVEFRTHKSLPYRHRVAGRPLNIPSMCSPVLWNKFLKIKKNKNLLQKVKFKSFCPQNLGLATLSVTLTSSCCYRLTVSTIRIHHLTYHLFLLLLLHPP